MRERLVFDGRVQGCGANMKFLSKQALSIKMTYICREHGVGGIGANHVAQKLLPPSAAFFSSTVVVCLIGTLMDVFFIGKTELCSLQSEVDIWFEGCIFASCHNSTTTPHHFQAHFSFLLI